jgi:hypothetical protein
MSVFPQLGIINEKVAKTINDRIGNNVEVSKLIPWFRVSSAGHIASTSGVLVDQADIKGTESKGLILESIPAKNSFAAAYGKIIDTERKSGRVGTDFQGDSVYADGVDRAHRPSPTIDSLSIENGNKGLSKKASFSITCYTLAQAEKISEYFLEPGFVVLVEWGYNLQQSISQKADLKSEGPCGIARYNNYEYTLNKREKSGGTYDGFMGYITDGGMTNGENETYTIDVSLVTIGEIPAYLQMHKNGSTSEIEGDELKKAKSTTQFLTTDIDSALGADNVGKALFMQMYNRLPAEKQTLAVKNLITEKDRNGNAYTLEANYINMDDQIREEIGNAAGVTYTTDKGTLTIPDGMSVITNQSFIRLELAFDILNKYAVKIDTSSSPCSDNIVAPFNFVINGYDTVLRAHKHIFSTDLSKVYIPNSNLPEFGLKNAFTKEPTTIFMDVNKLNEEGNTVDGCFFKVKQNYAFPSTVEYTSPYLKDTTPKTAAPHTWGYLRNLYINFDFFVEVMSRTNLVVKDIIYELLNGISAAVNSYWEFDLYMTPYNPVISDGKSKTGNHPYELSIQETTFSGNVSKEKKMTEWVMQGINTPFLTSKVDISIPAMMRNHTLGLRSSAKVQNQIEGNPQRYLFAQGEDRVLHILNSFKVVAEKEYKSTATTDAVARDNAIRNANLNLFLSRIMMIPIVQDRRKGTGAGFWAKIFKEMPLSKVFIIAGWNDSIVLNDVRMIDEHKSKPTDDTITNPAILSIGFDFDIIGVSGIKVGDLFKIKDLPKQFKDHGIFQVMDITHALSNGTWTTSVKSKMRNM